MVPLHAMGAMAVATPDVAIRQPKGLIDRVSRSRWLVAAFLTILAAIPRTVFPGLSEFKLDESVAILSALDAIHQHVIPLQGQSSSVAEAAQGPLLYDLAAAVLAVTPDPRFVVATIGLLNALSVGLTFVMCAPRFGRRIALFASVLYAAGAWPIVFSRKIWPNDLLGPAAVIALWGLLRALDPKTRIPGLGRTWVALAALVSLNFGAWPEAVVPAIAMIALPRTRQGRAGLWSLAGLGAFVLSVIPRVRDGLAILGRLTSGTGRGYPIDLSPFGFIVQLAGTDAFRLLAGPSEGFVVGAGPSTASDLVLHWLLLAGAVIALTQWMRGAVTHQQLLSAEGIVLLWWLSPAAASVVHGPIQVYVHHFAGTFPTQYILIAVAIAAIERMGGRGLEHLSRLGGVTLAIPRAVGPTFVVAAASAQLVVFFAFLQFIGNHPFGTFFGIPLEVSMEVAEQAKLDLQTGPVVILSSGDQVGVDADPTIFAALTDNADLTYVNANHTIVIPGARSSTLLASPDVRTTALELISPWQGPNGPLSDLGSIGGPTGFERFAAHPVTRGQPAGWIDLTASLDDGSSLLAATLPLQTRAGQRLGFDVAWRVGRPPARPVDQSVFAHLVADDGRPIADQDFSPLPLHSWQAGDVVVNRFSLGIPALTPSGRYWVDVGRYHRPDLQPVRFATVDERPGPSSLRLGPVAIPPDSRSHVLFAATNVSFGNQIQLGGWRVQSDSRNLTVTLRWRPETKTATRYTVFVHLLDANGRIVAQNDSEPRDGQFPTSTWEPADVVTDSHRLSLAGIPGGRYRVEVGLYQPSTGRRLRVANGDSDTITTVDLELANVSG
jgi:hypothetical protein